VLFPFVTQLGHSQYDEVIAYLFRQKVASVLRDLEIAQPLG
jgi:hypothetical protein